MRLADNWWWQNQNSRVILRGRNLGFFEWRIWLILPISQQFIKFNTSIFFMQENIQELELEKTEAQIPAIDQSQDNKAKTQHDLPNNPESEAVQSDSEKQAEHLRTLQEENQRLADSCKRLGAEFDNYKKRTQKEMGELIQTANKRVVLMMLEVLDDIERAEKQAKQEQEVLPQGITLIFEKMRTRLQQVGVEKLTALDAEFDTDLHEAITELPVEEQRRGKVVEVVQSGYTLGGKVIRFAKVVIGK